MDVHIRVVHYRLIDSHVCMWVFFLCRSACVRLRVCVRACLYVCHNCVSTPTPHPLRYFADATTEKFEVATYIYTYVYVCICIHTYICVCVCKWMCIYVLSIIDWSIYMYVCDFFILFWCMYSIACVCVCVPVCGSQFLVHHPPTLPDISQTQQRKNQRSRVLRSTWANSLYIYINICIYVCRCRCIIHIYVWMLLDVHACMLVSSNILIGSYICMGVFFFVVFDRVNPTGLTRDCVCVTPCFWLSPSGILQAPTLRNPRSRVLRLERPFYIHTYNTMYTYTCVCVCACK